PDHPSAVLDESALRDACGDDADFLEEIVSMFLASAPGLLDQIRSAVDAGQAEAVYASAPSLKGAALSIRPRAVSQAAARLETCGQSGQLQDAPALTDALDAELHRLYAALHTMLGRRVS